MNRKKFCIVAGALFVLFISGSAFAVTDYSAMTTEELSALRGTLYNATQEERNAFRTEWQKRVQQMTQEEREKYLSSGPGNGAGRRDGTGLGNGSGSGKGGGQGNGQGNGGGNGAGNGAGNGKGNK